MSDLALALAALGGVIAVFVFCLALVETVLSITHRRRLRHQRERGMTDREVAEAIRPMAEITLAPWSGSTRVTRPR